MGDRYQSLDFLRGVSIFGMIFSAIIPYGVLPAWMYHIQNPPPTHALDMNLPGIGWVDLVFPIFIFCMGVAIPLSFKSGRRKYVKSVVTRFLRLWAFSYLYVLMNFANVDGIWPQLCTIAGFGALFLIYYKPSVKVIGIIFAVAIITIGHCFFGEVIGFHRRGIIIFLLAFLYLFGSLIWYFTRDCLGVRALIFALLFIFAHITRELDWPAITYANPNIRWWFNMEYFYFLILLLPATVVGDILRGMRGKGVPGERNSAVTECKSGWLWHILSPLYLLFVVWQCYALYMNIPLLNITVSVPVVMFFIKMAYKFFPQNLTFSIMAALLVVWGVTMGVVEGGVQKVPCTLSYCLVTCGISIYLLLFSNYICRYCSGNFLVRIFEGAGQNPLMGYVAFDLLLVPLMKATGLIAIYSSIYPGPDGNALFGVLRAAFATLFTMWIVALFSRKKIFWKA